MWGQHAYMDGQVEASHECFFLFFDSRAKKKGGEKGKDDSKAGGLAGVALSVSESAWGWETVSGATLASQVYRRTSRQHTVTAGRQMHDDGEMMGDEDDLITPPW